jgi:hypothetical protein
VGANLHQVTPGTHGDAPIRINLAVFVRKDGDRKLDGLTELQVDDSLVPGTKAFLGQKQHQLKALPTRGRPMIEHADVAFNGSVLKRHKSGNAMEQRESLKSTRPGPLARTPDNFATARARFHHAATSTVPQVACVINQSAQIRVDLAKESEFMKMDTAISDGHKVASSLEFRKLDLERAPCVLRFQLCE